MDLQEIMRQAQTMQEKVKGDMAEMAVSASSGGGAVQVVINGNKELTKIEIQPDALKDPELLADMILAAMSRAYSDVNEKVQNQLSGMLGGFDLSSLSQFFKP